MEKQKIVDECNAFFSHSFYHMHFHSFSEDVHSAITKN